MDPESVKQTIAANDCWSNSYKRLHVFAYDRFAEMMKISWKPPEYRQDTHLPFIPLEKEIDALIAGCGKKVASSLQVIKETGLRIGEVWRLLWIDLDEERRTLSCRPEKHGNPRMLKVSPKLIATLNALSKSGERVFGGTSLSSHRQSFCVQRRRLATKLQNPRLNRITFHSLRHWKATMEYHRTKDILYVKQLLGHKNINNTLIYTHLVTFDNEDDFSCRTAATVKEARELIEAGFEYVTDMADVKLFRKRK